MSQPTSTGLEWNQAGVATITELRLPSEMTDSACMYWRTVEEEDEEDIRINLRKGSKEERESH